MATILLPFVMLLNKYCRNAFLKSSLFSLSTYAIAGTDKAGFDAMNTERTSPNKTAFIVDDFGVLILSTDATLMCCLCSLLIAAREIASF